MPAAEIAYHGQRRTVAAAARGARPAARRHASCWCARASPASTSCARFFSYPISLSLDTIRNLGMPRTIGIGFSYLRSVLFPIKPEKNLEDFFINRFGRRLYLTFFKSYTEKVWGVPCDQISPEWGAQRIKGLSIYKTLLHLARKLAPSARHARSRQKDTETSLIEKFLYPKFGPGQMWEEVAGASPPKAAEILTGWRVERLEHRRPSPHRSHLGRQPRKPASVAASPAISSSPPCRSKS